MEQSSSQVSSASASMSSPAAARGQLLLESAQTVVEDADPAVVALKARPGHGGVVLTHGLERSIELPIALRRRGEIVVIRDGVEGTAAHRHIAGLRHEVKVAFSLRQPADEQRGGLRLLLGGLVGAKPHACLRHQGIRTRRFRYGQHMEVHGLLRVVRVGDGIIII